jgi:tRNA pseudouridine13 synthase
LQGDRVDLQSRLQRVAVQGVPNYFGEQRFGRGGQTLSQARQWAASGRRKLTRSKRSLFLSALRSSLFNELLAARIDRQSWNRVLDGDVCMLQGTRSRFACECCDADIVERAATGDIHPGLPLWGKGRPETGPDRVAEQLSDLAEQVDICNFLEAQGLELAYRAARLMPDDFCWQFCDDDSLELKFELPPGGYATAVLAELVQYKEGDGSGNGSE